MSVLNVLLSVFIIGASTPAPEALFCAGNVGDQVDKCDSLFESGSAEWWDCLGG